MPNLRIENTVTNTGIKNTAPNVRVSNFQGGVKRSTETIQAGMPWGILLAITRNSNLEVNIPAEFLGQRPTMNIKSI